MKKLLATLGLAVGLLLAAAPDTRAQSAGSGGNWTGIYAGINGGYALGSTTIDDQGCWVACSSQTFTPNGGMVGGTVGFNYQFGSTVLGLEGDWDYLGANVSKKTDWPSIHEAKLHSLATIRLRAGLALDKTLLYATGGLALLDQSVRAASGDTFTFSRSKLRAGLALGGGLEFALSERLSAKAEYLFVGTPAENPVQCQGSVSGCTDYTWSNFGAVTNLHMVRVGLNYNFTGAPGAQTAAAPSGGPWTGFYAGFNTGYALGTTTFDDQWCATSCSSQTLNTSGGMVGGTVGYNYQFGATVLGLEGDWDYLDAGARKKTTYWQTLNEARLRSLATIRLRAGLAKDRTLIYATGGLALLDMSVKQMADPSWNSHEYGFSRSKLRAGLALGGGVEFMLSDNFSLKTEYLFVTTPAENPIQDQVSTNSSCQGHSKCNYGYVSNLHILRAGLNYRFGGAMPEVETAAGAWTGFYVGVNGGYALGSTTIDDQNCMISCSSQTLNTSGGMVGGTVGYNYQFGATVLGLEADWDYLDASVRKQTDWPSVHESKLRSLATIRMRAGLALDKTLVYATGGLALLDQSVKAAYPGLFGFSQSQRRTGLALGGGAEFMLTDKISAKAEYLFVGVPAENSIPDVKYPNHGTHINYGHATNLHLLRAGLNYRF